MTITDKQVPAVLDAIEKFIKAKPGLDPRNYGTVAEADRRGYRNEANRISHDRAKALTALSVAREIKPYGDALEHAFKYVYSGSLSWTEDALAYCTGQYFPTEYRVAARAVLSEYVHAAKFWRAEVTRQSERVARGPFETVEAIADANQAIGHHWFDADARRFFHSKTYDEVYGGFVFVSSERSPNGSRQYSVRRADTFGAIRTLDEFGEHTTLRAARKAAQAAAILAAEGD